jgi:hypothetical protein
MRQTSPGILLVGLACLHDVLVTAINTPFRRVHTAAPRQGNVADVLGTDATFGFSNLYNNIYVADVFVQGQNFTVRRAPREALYWGDIECLF